MTETRTPPSEPGAALLRAGRFFRPGTPAPDLHSIGLVGGREADAFYRDRWSHDKVVNSTHGVNCTGSCRWKVYVKDGIITWEDREAKERLKDPVLAWADLQGDPERRRRYQRARGKGGLARASWDEAVELLIPTTATLGDARRLEESALPDGCSLDHEGGPGMGGDGPFGQDSGRRRLPLVSVENFHLLRRRQTSDDGKDA